jgi:hypothetical protein
LASRDDPAVRNVPEKFCQWKSLVAIKLTAADRASICRALRRGQRPCELAEDFGVTSVHVARVGRQDAGVVNHVGRPRSPLGRPPRGSPDKAPRSSARTEAAGLLVLATDASSTERLREGILVSVNQQKQLEHILGLATARSIAAFREQVAAAFDELSKTQLSQIQERAEKARVRIAKRKPIIRAQCRGYQKAWEQRRRLELEATL